jgi:hypothetical protein
VSADRMGSEPLAPSGDGRDGRTGRFLPGNRAGRGNPQAGRVAALRAALLREVTGGDLRAAVRALIDKATGGDVAAIRELLDRCIGRAPASDETEAPINTAPTYILEGECWLQMLANQARPSPEPSIALPIPPPGLT